VQGEGPLLTIAEVSVALVGAFAQLASFVLVTWSGET
jgi:hypothetical protein